MATVNINRVLLTGNLTSDPTIKEFENGGAICTLRIAVNGRVKRGDTWEDKPNFFNVKVWGKQGKNAAEYLSKGRPVAIDGRLEWSEWTDKDGNKRQDVQIIADAVQFLGGGEKPAERGSDTSPEETPVSVHEPLTDDDDSVPF